ncbi:cytoskeleton-associated protein 2-like isoform X1 [Ranitomeya variabilis]|uniref:cytoskeleton-associated protein 2-like isoform X1 n=2 Tax=Ranitomeya variabilis TaxID=490064 RepID=UPI004056C6FF
MAETSAATVQPLRASRRPQRQQPGGYRDILKERKLPEVSVARKLTSQKQSVPAKRPEIRSPLMERSNRHLQKKSEQIRPWKKMAEPVNKENIQPAVNKSGKSVTLTQSYLKTKQIKDERAKLVPTKDEPKPAVKPVLGTYKGKIVQSKINSFRKNSENKNLTEPNKPMPKSHGNRPQSSASVPKTLVRPAVNDVKPKRPAIPPVSSQIRPSTTVTKNKSEPVSVRRTTQVLTQQRPMQQKAQPLKPPMKTEAKKSNPVMPNKSSSAPVETLPEPQENKPAPPLRTASKFPKPRETAAERKERLAEWRQSKGKVVKRPPMAVVLPSTCSVHKEKPETKTEVEEPKEETRQLYWATMAEEDEQELFTLKLHQIFGGCQKLIDEGYPREEVLSILEKQVQNLPEAKQLSGYWECLARLEKRDGALYKVIAVCEEAVSAGAQPLEELRAILANALEQLKPDPEESVKKENEEDLKTEELKTEVKDETVEMAIKGKRRGKARALKNEPQSLCTPDRPPVSEAASENRAAASSVIRYSVCTTPHLEKMKKLRMNEGDSGYKNYKFLTPVRRSSRLEHKSHRLPDILKDHDPCISGIEQLGELEGTEACANAYIFRKNSALNEVIPKSATKK